MQPDGGGDGATTGSTWFEERRDVRRFCHRLRYALLVIHQLMKQKRFPLPHWPTVEDEDRVERSAGHIVSWVSFALGSAEVMKQMVEFCRKIQMDTVVSAEESL